MNSRLHTKKKRNSNCQTVIGLMLAGVILIFWFAAHIVGIFHFEWEASHAIVSAPLLFLLMNWLNVGLFIIAHDCMHGSLAPLWPWVNKAVGRLCLFLYIGFNFNELKTKHYLHHVYSGTANDPDFYARSPHRFLYWYWHFLISYFGWAQFLFASIVSTIYLLVLNVQIYNLACFWAIPAISSSLQLFFFGTYMPHRPKEILFIDHHRTRSNDFSWLLSLFTCFHFGYHHEHHIFPEAPWWQLPSIRDNFKTEDYC